MMARNEKMTDRLYERDSYCRKFSAIVESCSFEKGVYNVVLNQTVFFPEGGGQAADEGFINGIRVFDVQREGDIIIHKTESELPVGEEVICEIDWELRYSRMQSHTGEHILSGVVHSLFGYDNIGFHMGESVMLVDFNGALSQSDIERIEIASNRAIYKNADIVAFYPTMEEAKKLKYRSKIEIRDDIRIVTIGDDIDCCACCAPHLAKTGEVGLIKIIDSYSYKQGTRIEMVAGINALKDYMNLNTSNKHLMKILSAPRHGVEDAVREQNNVCQTLRGENQRISRKLALSELVQNSVDDSVYSISSNLSYDELRYCANYLIENEYNTCLLLSKTDADSFIYVVSSKNSDVRVIVKELNSAFSGKGGGQSNYAQGKIQASSEEEVRPVIERMLKKTL